MWRRSAEISKVFRQDRATDRDKDHAPRNLGTSANHSAQNPTQHDADGDHNHGGDADGRSSGEDIDIDIDEGQARADGHCIDARGESSHGQSPQLVASFGAAQAGGGAMKCADGRGAFLVVNGFTCFVTCDYYLSV